MQKIVAVNLVEFCGIFIEIKRLILMILLQTLKQFQNYLSFCYVNMSFTTETEQNNKTSYLDIHIIREQGKLITNVYQKQTFSSVCTHFDSFLPDS